MKALFNDWSLLLTTILILHWQESAENPIIFCYLIGVRLTARLRRV